MDLTRNFLETLYDEKLSRDFDRVIVVLGDEGVGKSTLMLQLDWFWRDYVSQHSDLEPPSPETVVSDIAWDRGEFKEALSNEQWYEPIIIHDANRVMAKKKSMYAEQVELEADLFDSRGLRKLMLMGYQSWETVPTVLQRRRAKNVIQVTSRGKHKVYGRKQIDHKLKKEKWPDTTFVDTFDSLEGTGTWEAFRDKDLEKKQERISPDDEEETMTVDEVVDEIMEEGPGEYISIHGGNGTKYVDADLIALDYGLSGNKARMAKKAIEREVMS